MSKVSRRCCSLSPIFNLSCAPPPSGATAHLPHLPPTPASASPAVAFAPVSNHVISAS
jgi:hypothetical protein